MKNEKITTDAKQMKRLSLEDFKLEKLSGTNVLSASDLSNALGGVAQETTSFLGSCPHTSTTTTTMDDCHS